jgi:hypothetical protein
LNIVVLHAARFGAASSSALTASKLAVTPKPYHPLLLKLYN